MIKLSKFSKCQIFWWPKNLCGQWRLVTLLQCHSFAKMSQEANRTSYDKLWPVLCSIVLFYYFLKLLVMKVLPICLWALIWGNLTCLWWFIKCTLFYCSVLLLFLLIIKVWKCLFVSTVSTNSAVFIATLIFADAVLAYWQLKSQSAVAGHLSWVWCRGAEITVFL